MTWSLGKPSDGQLVGAPSGMTIDEHTGRIAWTPQSAGAIAVCACFASLGGGEATRSALIRRAQPHSALSICIRQM